MLTACQDDLALKNGIYSGLYTPEGCLSLLSYCNSAQFSDISPEETFYHTALVDDVPRSSSTNSDHDLFSFNGLNLKDHERTSGASNTWEVETLESLSSLPLHLIKFETTFSCGSLGPFKDLAVYYLNRFGPRNSEKLSRNLSMRYLFEFAKVTGLVRVLMRLHFENAGQLALLPSHQDYLVFRAEAARKATLRKQNSLVQINLHRQSGKVAYFEGIELVLGRERDSLLRPKVNALFREKRNACRVCLSLFGLKCKDLRNWTVAEFCKALFALSTLDASLWDLAVSIHASKIQRVKK